MRSFIKTGAKLERGKEVRITGEEARHLFQVLRLGPGDHIEISDGEGGAFRASLLDTTPSFSTAKIIEPIDENREAPLKLVLAQALLKGDKLDWVIQKGTELGVQAFVPFSSKRTVVKLTGEKAKRRQARWQRIAHEAAKQCGRFVVPKVEPILELEDILQGLSPEAVNILPWEEEKKQGLKLFLQENKLFRGAGPVLLIIGPEGGFEPEEVDMAKNYGVAVVNLGPRILRAETAAIAAATMVLYESGGLGWGSGVASSQIK